MEIQIVKFFQSLSNKFTDVFFWLITKLGEETVFLCVLAIIYLCYSNKFAIKFTAYYLSSVAINNVFKLICKRPRPYVASSEVVDRLHAGGYSFPSGHTQGYFVNATTCSLEINKKSSNNKLKISVVVVLSIVGILVMISRMFWGQHYLTDVIMGMSLGIMIPFFLDYLINILPDKFKKLFTVDRIYNVLGCIAVIVIIANIFVNIFAGKSIDMIYKFAAVFLSMSVGYFVNKRKIKYITNQGWKIGLFKSLITIACIAIIYIVFDLIFTIESYLCLIVYLFLGLFCTIILPIIFKLLFKKGYNNEESNN